MSYTGTAKGQSNRLVPAISYHFISYSVFTLRLLNWPSLLIAHISVYIHYHRSNCNVGARFRYYTAVAAVLSVLSTLSVAPHYLAYFNEAFGGPANGYKFLADSSNLDWGQDLKGLKRFMEKNTG